MNKITLTNRDFWPKRGQLMLAKMLENPIHTYEDTLMFCKVIQIMEDNWGDEAVVLDFPEKYYPNNYGHFFWTKVAKLLSDGLTITIKTSDVRGATYIDPKLCLRFVEWYDKESESYKEYELEGHFGSTTDRAGEEISF